MVVELNMPCPTPAEVNQTRKVLGRAPSLVVLLELQRVAVLVDRIVHIDPRVDPIPAICKGLPIGFGNGQEVTVVIVSNYGKDRFSKSLTACEDLVE